MKTGALIISLDFELFWGVRDHRTLRDYGAKILGVRKAIPAMLELFKEFGIHATWATVGFLFFDRKQDLLACCPETKPSYNNKALSPYNEVTSIGETEQDDPYHLGRSLLELIRTYPGQEIASHTFSHYYCLEPGQDARAFSADMQAAVRVASTLGIKMESLVFPRNQTRPEYLDCCHNAGIHCYRGNENNWIYSAGAAEDQSSLRRILRLADSYLNLTGHNTYPWPTTNGMLNLPSSRFLRPFSRRLAWADPLRKRRIESAIRHAARNGEIFHLWWHPHNFGANLPENLQFLRGLLECFAAMRTRHGIESLNMAEAAERTRHA